MEKLQLNFMVAPDHLASKAIVPNGKRVKILDINGFIQTGLLGQSGVRMAQADFEWILTGKLADDLISKNIVEEVK